MMKLKYPLLLLTLLAAGCNQDPLSQRGKVFLPPQEGAQSATAADSEPGALLKVAQPLSSATQAEEIDWDDLIPPDWRADPQLIELYQAGKIGDDDPRVIETRERLAAPVQPANPALEGRRIKLAGFVVPLEVGNEAVTEFLLVPYHGACIHVPPPPTNQTVLVRTGKEGTAIRKLFDTVWVIGTLTIEQSESDLAESGYTLHAERVEPYEE